MQSREMEPLRLGPFELGEEISRGGMGTVMHGRHTSTGRPVAVKILSGDRAHDPVFLRGFRREVRSVAALDHPRIITVYDFGLLEEDLAERRADFSTGAPWIAMEYAEFGSLHAYPQLNEWRDLQSVLFDILDGLAHAHARDIVHRDLKPGNVLLVPENGLIRCKLSDFGIAHARGAARATHEVFASAAGTPWFMAPEQVESQWRDYGPWTDLYALGTLAYRLVSGNLPFDGDSAVEVARKQLFERPPPLEPRLAVPDGLSEWIERLMQKEIGMRFQRAADALWALRKISPDNPSGMRAPVARPPVLVDGGADTIPSPAPAEDHFDTALTTLTFDRGFDFEAFPSLEEISSPTSLAASMPPIPDDWRPRLKSRKSVLGGAGLGLFGLRETPFVNREVECDLIWNALKHIAERRTAQGIVLEGPSGVGKARLAEWIARRAHEVGAAKVLVARHGPMSGAFDGVRRMLDVYAGTTGLDIERTYERLRHQLMSDAIDPVEIVRYRAAALARFLRPGHTSTRVPPVRIAGRDELFAVLRGTLVRYSRSRPVLIVLRDVQWAPGALELARQVLANQDSSPARMLLIATVGNDLPETDAGAGDALESLCRRGNVIRRTLDPLDDAALGELIDGVIELNPQVRDSLVEATHGNPLFCLQVLGHWIDERRLRPGQHGFDLEGDKAFPKSTYDLWLERLRSAAQGFEGDSLSAMEVAASLGMEVDIREWREACELLGYDVPAGIVDRVIERGLIRRSSETWEFTHALLREALVDQSQRSGRAAKHHDALARVLQVRGFEARARRARHLELAGHAVAALEVMCDVIDEWVDASLFTQAEQMIERAERLIRVAGLGSKSKLWGRLVMARGEVALAHGDMQVARNHFEEVSELATRRDWPELLVRAMRGAYEVLQNDGAVEEAARRLTTALTVARQAGLAKAQVRVARSLGWLHQRRGDADKARELLEETIRLANALENGERERSISEAALAEVLRSVGEVDQARSLISNAVAAMRQFGDRVGIGDALNVLAEIERRSDNLDKAEHAYREAMESFDLAGHVSGDLVRANLAMLYLARGRAIPAKELLERAAESFEERNMNYYLAFARFGLAQTSAVLGETAEWDELMGLINRLEQRFYEQEFIEIAVATAQAWKERDDLHRAAQASHLASRMLNLSGSLPEDLSRRVEQLEEELS